MIIWHSHELSHHVICKDWLKLFIIIIIFKKSFMNLVFMSFCKGQVIKISRADSYTSIVLGSLYVSWWLFWKQFHLMRELLKVTFFVTLSIFLINGRLFKFRCVYDSTSEMIWCRHFTGYSASTQTNIDYKWKNRTELFGSMNCQNTCKLQSLGQAIMLICDGDKDANCYGAKEMQRFYRLIPTVQNPMSSCSRVWMI